MKIRLFYPAFDPRYADLNDVDPKLRIQGTDLVLDSGLLSGLVAENVALMDFDPETGDLADGPEVIAPDTGRIMHRLSVTREDLKGSTRTVPAIQALCFGTVMRTISLLESKRVLGRKIKWAFDGEQLFVVPRAGYQANAFYHRDSHSVQFLLVPDKGAPSSGPGPDQLGKFTALSPDIVAHETGHAVIDGIAPYLYEAATPQSLALHEAVADLTALIVALKTRNFVTHILDKNDGALDKEAIGQIAEEIGSLSHPKTSEAESKAHGLRNLANNFALPDEQTGAVPAGMIPMHSQQPHALSEVLSGAMFNFFVKNFEAVQKHQANRGVERYEGSGYSVSHAIDLTTAILFRALDYLPPGEISFADFGRAMLAADEAVFPDSSAADSVRSRLVEELKRRNISVERTYVSQPDLQGEDLDLFADSENDWRVYDFVNRYKSLFRIPDNTPFRVHTPMLAERVVTFEAETDEIEQTESQAARHAQAEESDMSNEAPLELEEMAVRELILKVSWKQTEDLVLNGRRRTFRFMFGTTVSFDLDRKAMLLQLTTNSDGRVGSEDVASQPRQRNARADLIARWVQEDRIAQNGIDKGLLPQMLERDGVFELSNMAQRLHAADGVESSFPSWLQKGEGP